MAKQTFTTGQVLTAAEMTSLQQTAMGGGATTAKTTSYVLVAADAGTVVQMNAAGSTTITVNTALFAAGDTVQIQNVGAGVCTITAGTATVSTSAVLTLKQYDAGTLYFNSTSAAIFFAVDAADSTSPLTTKGDLYGFSTLDARIPIGTNNQVLTADSAQALGLKWATPAGGGKLLQLVNATTTTDTTLSTVTYTDTTLTATITPTLATSKILVIFNQVMRVYGTSNTTYGVGIKLLRGATVVADLSAANTRAFSIEATADGIPTLAKEGYIGYTHYDAPATTSATTYKVQFCLNTTTGSGTARVQTQNIPSSITLMEIGA